MNTSGRIHRLILTIKPGRSVRVEVSSGRHIIISRDKRGKLIFEEFVASGDVPHFRVVRLKHDWLAA